MASQPDQSRQHQADLAAALLLLGRRYDLPALIRANGIRPRRFRQIRPTEALRSDMASPYMALVRAWAAHQPALLAAYERAQLTGDLTVIRNQVETSSADIDLKLLILAALFPGIVGRLEQWHRGQWVQRIHSATTINVGVFTGAQEVATDVQNAVTWNQQLLGDVHSQAKGGISAALLAGIAVATPSSAIRAAVNGVLGKAKKRGLRIGVDQVDRTVRAMERSRRSSAGLAQFRWHHTPQLHPRDEHKARDMRVFNQSNAPNDRAGVLPFCKCWEEPLFGELG